MQILSIFKNTKIIVSDNEKSFESSALKTFLKNNFDIEQFFVPTLHSESNGQIERFHSTLLEISRCLHQQNHLSECIDLVMVATKKYNNSIHSVINFKPIDALHNSASEEIQHIKSQLIKEQEKMLTIFNKNTVKKIYHPGEKVFVRRNKRLGNKLDKVFVKKVIQKDLGTTVLIDGKRIRKSNLR